ncbi:MAG TPA: PKD domain-containing protein [Candidatus Limnocylindrales bacterium]|nr:PKD domain-containing protein [Candidatus Limnocylindrales bacterium]
MTGGSSEIRGLFRRGREGQSLAEFALILPVVLLLTLIAIDFGRVYLGWVNLQNMARVAANFAANNPTAWATNDAEDKADYQAQILADATQNNCTLPLVGGAPTAPDPSFPGGTDIGGTAEVRLSCTFAVITPLVGLILGNGGNVTVSASSTFPIKNGIIATGGAGVAPVANFTGSPTTVTEGGSVQFADTSTGIPTIWQWDFGDGQTAVDQNPLHAYATAGRYSVRLTVTNADGSDSEFKFQYITVGTPPPLVDFTGTPVNGDGPLTVSFVGTSTDTPTSVVWTFGDGATDSSGSLAVSHTYTTAGTYTVRLDVTAPSGSGTVTKSNYITVGVGVCVVPSFIDTSTTTAQTTWNDAGFTTTVTYKQGGLPWTIKSQNLTGGTSVPCNSTIQVSRN